MISYNFVAQNLQFQYAHKHMSLITYIKKTAATELWQNTLLLKQQINL